MVAHDGVEGSGAYVREAFFRPHDMPMNIVPPQCPAPAALEASAGVGLAAASA